MNEKRMCAYCKKMKPKSDLIRVAKDQDGVARIDLSFKSQGRGCYFCKNVECISQAEHNRSVERALRSTVYAGLYDDMRGQCGQC